MFERLPSPGPQLTRQNHSFYLSASAPVQTCKPILRKWRCNRRPFALISTDPEAGRIGESLLAFAADPKTAQRLQNSNSLEPSWASHTCPCHYLARAAQRPGRHCAQTDSCPVTGCTHNLYFSIAAGCRDGLSLRVRASVWDTYTLAEGAAQGVQFQGDVFEASHHCYY